MLLKPRIIKYVAEQANIGQLDARNAIKAYHELLREELSQPLGAVFLPGLGKFMTVYHPPREMYLSVYGEKRKVPGRLRIIFKMDRNLSHSLRDDA